MTRETNDAEPRVLMILTQNVGEKMEVGAGIQIRRKGEPSDDPT